MNRLIRLAALPILLLILPQTLRADPIPNSQIDGKGFISNVIRSHETREQRRVTEEQFLEMAKDKNTLILDARSPVRFEQMHISGAKNLAFTDFTEAALKVLIPSKDSRILIYCNNNVENSPVAFPSKMASASLNLSTLPALYSYGYKNVYELGPVLDPAKSKIKFEGSLLVAGR